MSENSVEIGSQDYKPQFIKFHDLMRFRVREILLVSSFYDAFVLEEDGRLSEKIFSEYVDLNLRFIPRITRVSNAEEAFDALKNKTYDMVITMTRISDMNPYDFGLKVKQMKPSMPVILLTFEWIGVEWLIKFRDRKSIDKVFYWSGDTRILLSIIKFVEDMKNVDHDTKLGVRVILVVEDSPRFYSLFLPIIYTEIMTQTRMLISEGVNDLHRLLRMRARPKIIMAETYEEAKKLYRKYKNRMLGIISDIRFPRKGELDPEAGLRLAKKVKSEIPDIPFLLQSSEEKNLKPAKQLGICFINKNKEDYTVKIKNFILSSFGFGDFVFKTPEGKEIARAKNLSEFINMLKIIPEDSLSFHASRNHFSIWLRARTEFELAEELRPKKVSDFNSIQDLREHMIESVQNLLNKNRTGVITDFTQTRFDSQNSFVRIGNGSLGGKARGIAFLNTLINKSGLKERFKDIEIKTPNTFVVCSEVFDDFIESNDLLNFAINENNNTKIAKKFLKSKLPEYLNNDLYTIVKNINYPLAIRSSSLLEDSQMLPFAGLYSTYMIPNNSEKIKVRLRQLKNAIKLVFASVYFKSPKEYVKNTYFRIEEEKMSVIIQQVAGQRYEDYFYPVVSGVAQSYNFYPISHMEPDDGISHLALGLGMTIVEGERVYTFSPRYPNMNPPYSTPLEFVKNSQTVFYALDMSESEIKIVENEKFSLKKLSLEDAERHGTLFFVGSTYSGIDNAIRDTLSIKGPRVITFANILKYNIFPLADILTEILKIGFKAFGSHIEIEFAVNLFSDKERKPEFYLLQIRPMVVGSESIEIDIKEDEFNNAFISTEHSLGNGVYDDLDTIVFVDPDKFDISKSVQIAREVGEINEYFKKKNKNYVLIGFGRWATSDRWLGIPVDWSQISQAKVIIESNTDKLIVEPSHGSHFFHNMIALRLGYFHIRRNRENEFINWDFIKKDKSRVKEFSEFVSYVEFNEPFIVKINGRTSRAIIFKF